MNNYIPLASIPPWMKERMFQQRGNQIILINQPWFMSLTDTIPFYLFCGENVRFSPCEKRHQSTAQVLEPPFTLVPRCNKRRVSEMREKREKDSAFQLESVHAVSPCVGRSEILTWRREKMHRDCLELQSSRNGWRNFHSLPHFYIPFFSYALFLSPAVFFPTPSHASLSRMVRGISSGSKERKTKLKTVTSSSVILHEFSSVFLLSFQGNLCWWLSSDWKGKRKVFRLSQEMGIILFHPSLPPLWSFLLPPSNVFSFSSSLPGEVFPSKWLLRPTSHPYCFMLWPAVVSKTRWQTDLPTALMWFLMHLHWLVILSLCPLTDQPLCVWCADLTHSSS